MKTIQVFDPALCCSTGVCGVDVDQRLVDFSATARWAEQNGIAVERYNLAQQPMAFAESPVVKAFLEASGEQGLPVILVDGMMVLSGRYPDRAELARLAGVDTRVERPVDTAGACCGSATDESRKSSGSCC
jgi:hypothetical protein